MAIDDLPGPVVTFLNVLGIPWPYVNEDDIHEFASVVRQFGQAVEQTHRDATETVGKMTQAYQGAATQQMQSGWAQLSSQHVDEIVAGCTVLSGALEVGAVWIVAQKVEALVILVEMAMEFLEAQAAAVETLGASEAAVPLIIEVGKKLMKTLTQLIIQYITGQIVEAAAKPLFDKIEQALSGLDWSHAPSSGADPGAGFQLEAEHMMQHITALRGHAATMHSHAQTASNGLVGLNF